MVLSQLKSRLSARKPRLNPEQFYKWNQGLALFHAVQGALILFLSATKTLPVQSSFFATDPLASQVANESVLTTATRHLFDINIAYLVAIFFFVSAIVHVLLASIARKRYEAELKKGVNSLRWIDYAVSESLMVATIALLAGVSDISLLIAILGLTVLCNMIGLVTELAVANKAKTGCGPLWLSAVTGFLPWLIIGIYLWGSAAYGQGAVHTYLYWLVGSAFVLSAGFIANAYLQYKKIGPWKNYLQAEYVYMMLNWAVKTAVAWQIFAGVLHR